MNALEMVGFVTIVGVFGCCAWLLFFVAWMKVNSWRNRREVYRRFPIDRGAQR